MSCTYNSTAHAHDRDETILRLFTRGAPHITQKTEFEEKMRAQIDEHSNVLGSSRYYSLCIVATNDTVEHTIANLTGGTVPPFPLGHSGTWICAPTLVGRSLWHGVTA